MSVSIDHDAVAAVLREVAASEVLPRFRNLSKDDVRAKASAQDLVTLADLEAERVLSARLPGLLPGSVVVGEEAAYADAAILERLRDDAPVWVIDPVDGTANFSAGRPTFAMIVALVDRGRTVAGWIHDPLRDRMAMAERGAGARIDGATVSAKPAQFRPSAWEGCAYGPRAKALKGRVGRLHRLGSAAHCYLRLLDHCLQFSAFSRLKPWDHAAGVLLWHEAGGICRLLDGSDYAPTLAQGELLMAPCEPSWRALADILSAAPSTG